jgi:hypothetical protein
MYYLVVYHLRTLGLVTMSLNIQLHYTRKLGLQKYFMNRLLYALKLYTGIAAYEKYENLSFSMYLVGRGSSVGVTAR